MIRKVYKIDPLNCPNCQGQRKVIAFITDYPAVDRIIRYLQLFFQPGHPPSPQIAQPEHLMDAEGKDEYF